MFHFIKSSMLKSIQNLGLIIPAKTKEKIEERTLFLYKVLKEIKTQIKSLYIVSKDTQDFY